MTGVLAIRAHRQKVPILERTDSEDYRNIACALSTQLMMVDQFPGECFRRPLVLRIHWAQMTFEP